MQPSYTIDENVLAIFGFMIILFVFLLLAHYIFNSLCLYKIAKKTNTPEPWFAWIPLLDILLAIQIARKPVWWIILMFIPPVNLVVYVLIFMEISKRVGKADWLGILMIFPILNLIIYGYLAFSSSSEQTSQTPTPIQ